MLQHAERGVMTYQTFKITTGGTGNGRAAHAGRREHIVKTVNSREACDSGRGQEPAGKRQQPDTGK
ncbi:Uncharacterised protein [Salmonella enterica subsp. enterica serovar Bovismorbificans]|uniref:Uncharacterized protein n=1 Tax=Salmonella enterica subsp. enterica serovar Bovismorbificans TaxID=58097 RepID=A0A655D0L5_SALET|nr:Uncharacterised protein [Salmonella enterica subsp. enterica serovar Bovismorbificans]